MTYEELAGSRIAAMYRNAPKFRAWLLSYILKAQSLDDTYVIMGLMLDVDKSQGDQLDIIGRIVGVKRPAYNQLPNDCFGYIPNPDADPSFGTANPPPNPYDVSPYVDPNQQALTIPAPDSWYASVIKSQIVVNNSMLTIDDIIVAIEFFIGVEVIELSDNEDMTFSIILASEPAPNVAPFVSAGASSLIPSPAGVRYTGYSVQ